MKVCLPGVRLVKSVAVQRVQVNTKTMNSVSSVLGWSKKNEKKIEFFFKRQKYCEISQF